MTPWGFGVDPDQEKLERLRRGLEGLHGVVKSAVVDPLTLPGDVVAGKFNTAPSVPGFWSDEDEARAQLNDRAALGRTIDLGGAVMTSTLPAVAAHVAQHGTKGLTNPDTLGIFAGAGALTADANKLATAQRMAKEGATPSDIWDATGWMQGADKKWRFEIDDSKMTVRPDAARMGYDTKLGDIVDHPEFFAAYPDAKNIKMMWGEGPNRGAYSPSPYPGEPERLHLSQFDKPEVHRSIGLHEMQHAVQEREGFARGGNTSLFQQQDDAKLARDALSWRKELDRLPNDLPSQVREEAVLQQYRDIDAHDFIPPHQARLIAHDFEGNPTEELQKIVKLYGLDKRLTPYTPTEMYKRVAGEVEARNVQARRDMTPERRREIDPRYSQDIQYEDQIVMGPHTMDDLEELLAGRTPIRPVEHSPLDPENLGIYRERALRDAERNGGSAVRMFPSRTALDRWRGVTPAKAGTWESDVANAKAGFGAAVGDAREIMNDARAAVQSWGTRADDEAFLRDNMAWSTGDVPPFSMAPLPMDEPSRMARAEQMGFRRDAFHGTQAPEFDAFKRKRNDIGIHFGTADQANDRMTYMRDAGQRPEEGMRVLPVKLKVNNPLRVSDLGAWNSENLFYGLGHLRKGDGTPLFDKEELRRAAFTAKNEAGRTASLRQLIESKGYDGLVYRNTGEVGGSEPYRATVAAARKKLQAAFPGKKGSWQFSPEEQKHPAYVAWKKADDSYDRHREAMGEDSFIAFRPQQVRSRFAAFDPKKADSSNMMASMGDVPPFDPSAQPFGSLAPQGIRAYHGSPHDFDRFDISKIGTGEGAQAYGHGLYFAENEAVARNYRDTIHAQMMFDGKPLANIKPTTRDEKLARHYFHGYISPDEAMRSQRRALERYLAEGDEGGIDEARRGLQIMEQLLPKINTPSSASRMYEVNIRANPDRLLDWDVPLSRQSPYVKDALKEIGIKSDESALREFDDALLSALQSDKPATLPKQPRDPMGETLYTEIGLHGGGYGRGARPVASEKLREVGVPGIKYLDQGSRGTGTGSRNFVVFDDSIVDILRKYGLAGAAPVGVAAAAAGAREE